MQFRRDANAAGASVTVLPQTGLREAISALPKPCGILGANDDCAVKAYHAATTAGLSIPDDVAIAGIDNDEMFCESVTPGLTSAEPDFEGAGYRLAQMLAEEIDEKKKRKGKRGKERVDAHWNIYAATPAASRYALTTSSRTWAAREGWGRSSSRRRRGAQCLRKYMSTASRRRAIFFQEHGFQSPPWSLIAATVPTPSSRRCFLPARD